MTKTGLRLFFRPKVVHFHIKKLQFSLRYRPHLDPGEAAAQQGLPKFKVVGGHDLRTAAHFCNYAFAAYGYMLYIWSQPSSKCGLLKLCWEDPVLASCNRGHIIFGCLHSGCDLDMARRLAAWALQG